MVNENIIPKTEIVYELKDKYKIPSYEEFLINHDGDERVNYEDLVNSDIGIVEGYGPCKNTLCGCFCPKTKCDCTNPEFSIYKEDNRKIGNATASGSVGLGGNALSGDVDFSLYREARHDGELKIGTISAGVDLVNGGFGGLRASANLIDFKSGGVEVKAGLNLDTGGSISANGLELKAAGFGVSIGEKLEISTIAGGISCVIQ
ncbi:hypothetical protein [endosymbiont GvMRE of Glomus versiforme]|uniref:hypothetical protein n=1 Tax=endosymbiont GvMRE of Glomus versiforme TaxID=2039283 RepID=UPI000EC5C9CE|nr:hypothetical protein [endosymbiont GvMRE of Glomus versiforme]RHZ35313.1 hypothetical protein GvMRE_IIg146 [endosymbiont GvMRE of Glomus versiforme]